MDCSSFFSLYFPQIYVYKILHVYRISLSAEHQKLCVRERERSNAGARGQSFLELYVNCCRMKFWEKIHGLIYLLMLLDLCRYRSGFSEMFMVLFFFLFLSEIVAKLLFDIFYFYLWIIDISFLTKFLFRIDLLLKFGYHVLYLQLVTELIFFDFIILHTVNVARRWIGKPYQIFSV